MALVYDSGLLMSWKIIITLSDCYTLGALCRITYKMRIYCVTANKRVFFLCITWQSSSLTYWISVSVSCFCSDEFCGDHRECQRWQQKVWGLVQRQRGSLHHPGMLMQPFLSALCSDSFSLPFPLKLWWNPAHFIYLEQYYISTFLFLILLKTSTSGLLSHFFCLLAIRSTGAFKIQSS